MLKTPSTISDCDVRYVDAVVHDPETGALRKMVLEDMWALVAPFELPEQVPKDIRDQFDKARHAFIYSWFSYDLATLAEQQSYAVLEMALRERYRTETPQATDRPMLANLLHVAQKRKWLIRDEFAVPSISGTSEAACLLDMLPMLRNELAHGSTRLLPVGSLEMMRLCFDVIRKLFPPPASP